MQTAELIVKAFNSQVPVKIPALKWEEFIQVLNQLTYERTQRTKQLK